MGKHDAFRVALQGFDEDTPEFEDHVVTAADGKFADAEQAVPFAQIDAGHRLPVGLSQQNITERPGQLVQAININGRFAGACWITAAPETHECLEAHQLLL